MLVWVAVPTVRVQRAGQGLTFVLFSQKFEIRYQPFSRKASKNMSPRGRTLSTIIAQLLSLGTRAAAYLKLSSNWLRWWKLTRCCFKVPPDSYSPTHGSGLWHSVVFSSTWYQPFSQKVGMTYSYTQKVRLYLRVVRNKRENKKRESWHNAMIPDMFENLKCYGFRKQNHFFFFFCPESWHQFLWRKCRNDSKVRIPSQYHASRKWHFFLSRFLTFFFLCVRWKRP